MGIHPINQTACLYPYSGINGSNSPVNAANRVNGIDTLGSKSIGAMDKVKPSECQTCKNRKYIDGSDDNSVSFQTPTHVSPSSSFAAVSAHEHEHISHAAKEGNKEGNQLLSAHVTLKMAVCPECGTPYVEGGVTRTTIAYNTSSPYENHRKSLEKSLLLGMNFDTVA